MKKTFGNWIAKGTALGLLAFLGSPAGAQVGDRLVTLEEALAEGIVKLGVQGLGPDKVRLNIQSLVLRPLKVILPRGAVFGSALVTRGWRAANRVREMLLLEETRIPLGPKKLVSRDLPALGLDLRARIPQSWDVLVLKGKRKVPGGERLLAALDRLRVPWEVRQAAFWILCNDALCEEVTRKRPKRPGGFGPRPIPPLAFAAGMMSLEAAGFSLAGRRCNRHPWVLVPAARPRLYPVWGRALSRWALARLHARGHEGEYSQVILSILEKDPDPRVCLEAFKVAAASRGPKALAAMERCLERFPELPEVDGFSPRRVLRALVFSAGRSYAAPAPSGGAGVAPSRLDLDRLLSRIRGGGPGAEKALADLALLGRKIRNPKDRIRVGKTLAVCLDWEFPFPGTALVKAVGAFRDTWDLGKLLRILARRGEVRAVTRCVWVRLVALYPDWAATNWLLDRIYDPDKRVRAEAVRALEKRRDAVGPLLARARGGPSLEVRLAALDALAGGPGAKSIPVRRAVYHLLGDPSDRIRAKAADLLVRWKCGEYLSRLIELCASDPSQRVRWAAARGIRLLGDAGAARKIRALLGSGGRVSRELHWALAGLEARR